MTWMDVAQAVVLLTACSLILVTTLIVFVMMTDKMDRE